MEKESQITEKDYREFFKEYHLWYKPTYKILSGVFIIILFALSIYENKNYTWTGTLTTLLIVAFFMFGILFAVPYTIEIMRMELTRSSHNFNGYTINITGEGIIVTEGGQQTLYKLSNVKRSRLTQNFLGIRLYHKIPGMRSSLLLVHRADFSSGSEINQFFNNTYKFAYTANPLANRQKIPYAWGLLGIIPFVGGVNGIIMVINGIFKFKSIAYVILGAIGIFFTGAIIYMFYSMAPNLNDKAFEPSFRSAAQDNLNSLVKSIEFYKLQHGEYPDSLKQLTDNEGIVSIYDPIYAFKKKEPDHLFNYKKMGNKYILFSSGIDMIPHTADDIYPTISITDTSKIGLIRPDSLKMHSN